MRVVKLNRRHKFYEYGYTHGFVGSCSDGKRPLIEKYLESIYGHHNYDSRSPWYGSFTGSRSHLTGKDSGGREFSYQGRTYWICVRNPADITAALLAMGT